MEIDVSKCKYHNDGWCELPESRDDIRYKPCGDMTLCDCYYKQLQQLKAELQAYKDKIKPINFVDSDEYLKVVVENKQLKAENDKLKAELDNYKLGLLDLTNGLDFVSMKKKLERIKAECSFNHSNLTAKELASQILEIIGE